MGFLSLISKSYLVYGSLYLSKKKVYGSLRMNFDLIQIGFGLPFKVEVLALLGEVKNMSI